MTSPLIPYVVAPRLSRLVGVAAALQAHLITKNPGYTVTTSPDFNYEGMAVIYYNGEKGNGDFFAGSYVIRRRDTPGSWRFYLCCPEHNRATFLIGDDEDTPTVTRMIEHIFIEGP